MEQYVQITIIGIGIVFLALAMLFVIFNILGRLLSKEQTSVVKALVPKPVPTNISGRPEKQDGDEGEVIAAITAAVTSFMGHSNFKVRSVASVPVAAASLWKRREPTVYWKVRRSRN